MSSIVDAGSAYGSGISQVIPVPYGHSYQEGDLICIAISATSYTMGTFTGPSGFTTFTVTSASGYPGSRFCYKVAGAGEPTSYTSTSVTSLIWCAVIWGYRGLVRPDGHPAVAAYNNGYGQGVTPVCKEVNSTEILLDHYRAVSILVQAGSQSQSIPGLTWIYSANNSTSIKMVCYDEDYYVGAGGGPEMGRRNGTIYSFEQYNTWRIAVPDSVSAGAWAIGMGGGGGPVPPSGPSYRMRGYDGTLARQVYWTATVIDPTGSQYSGPGPLSDVVVSKIIGGT